MTKRERARLAARRVVWSEAIYMARYTWTHEWSVRVSDADPDGAIRRTVRRLALRALRAARKEDLKR